MAERRIRLVHSASTPQKAGEERSKWGLENARQLKLFDDLDRIRMVLVPVADVTGHAFRRALRERCPKLIVDTRSFPDFFSIFASTDSALAEFNSLGINYNRVPLLDLQEEVAYWARLSALKEILCAHLERKTGSPVFLLGSTSKSLSDIASNLQGYLSQEVAETRFEEVSA